MLEPLTSSAVLSSGREPGRSRVAALDDLPCVEDSSATSGGGASARGGTVGEPLLDGGGLLGPLIGVVSSSEGGFCTEGRTAFPNKVCKTRTRLSRSTPVGIRVVVRLGHPPAAGEGRASGTIIDRKTWMGVIFAFRSGRGHPILKQKARRLMIRAGPFPVVR
jgi:hypothetical protein